MACRQTNRQTDKEEGCKHETDKPTKRGVWPDRSRCNEKITNRQILGQIGYELRPRGGRKCIYLKKYMSK